MRRCIFLVLNALAPSLQPSARSENGSALAGVSAPVKNTPVLKAKCLHRLECQALREQSKPLPQQQQQRLRQHRMLTHQWTNKPLLQQMLLRKPQPRLE